MVELVFIEIKAAHQGTNRAVARVQGHKSPFDLGQLGDLPLGAFENADHRAGPELDIGRCFVGQARLNWLEPLTGDFDHLAVLAHGPHHFWRGFEHHSGQQVALVTLLDQGVIDQLIAFARIGGQVDELFGPPVLLALFIVHDAPAQGLVGHLLIGGTHRGVDLQTTGIGIRTVLREHQGPRHLGHIVGVVAKAQVGIAHL